MCQSSLAAGGASWETNWATSAVRPPDGLKAITNLVTISNFYSEYANSKFISNYYFNQVHYSLRHTPHLLRLLSH